MRRLCTILITLAIASSAHADTWMLPTRKTFVSADKNTRLTVMPREVASQLTYFEDKVKGREPAVQLANEAKRTARGILERRVDGRWTKVCSSPLLNEVAPVSVLVSNDGRHVVTFDNWHSVGLGDNVVVIYRGDGSPVRSLKLKDILPADFIAALPRSVSSLYWHRMDRFAPDEKHLLISIVVPSEHGTVGEPSEIVELAVDLDTGATAPPTGPAWDSALAKANQITAANAASEAVQRAAFVAPLAAPATTDERSWHGYMREAFLRVDPDWKRRSPSTTVLRAPTAPNYAPSVGWVRDAIQRGWDDDVVMLAAPTSPDQLVAIIVETAPKLKPRSLRTTRVYVAVPAAEADAIRKALAPTGAEVVRLNTATQLPQRPERLRGETPLDLMAAADALEALGEDAKDAVSTPAKTEPR